MLIPTQDSCKIACAHHNFVCEQTTNFSHFSCVAGKVHIVVLLFNIPNVILCVSPKCDNRYFIDMDNL